MTTPSSPPVGNDIVHPVGFPGQHQEKPPSRWRRMFPGQRRRKAAIAGGLAGLLVAGLLGASYETSPGGTLWGVEKSVFPEHAQDVALTAVVNDLKQAQDILGSGQQPTADQLTDARTHLNQAKQNLDYLSDSPQRDSLQNLYLQLTQQLLQYTPDSVQQLPPLPGLPDAPPAPSDPAAGQLAPDPVALTSGSAPTWGYGDSGDAESVAGVVPDDFVPPPPDVPVDPEDDWPQPYDPPLTPNLEDLGYYDQSWGQLYGYDPSNWYNFDLGGFNIYGFDFLGFNRWGYDRWGYDRWGYDHWGYNWSGHNWAGYDRDGWDRGGRNEWGQRRGWPSDPRNQDWYDHHHPYEQYYQWKFQNDDPVYHRTQWDQAHGFNPDRYRDWNMNRDWHNPRNRDWEPSATTVNNTTVINNVNARNSAPVVNPKTSLAQFISKDKAAGTSGPLMKDLANKSTRNFTKDLTAQTTTPIKALTPTRGQQPATPMSRQSSFAPPALTEATPAEPPSKVSPSFTVPKVAPAPAPAADKPEQKSGSGPRNIGPGANPNPSPGARVIPPSSGEPNSAVAPSLAGAPGVKPRSATPPNSVADAPARQDAPPERVAPAPQAPPKAPVRETQAPQAPAHQAPAPPARDAQTPKAPAHEAQAPQAPAPRPAPAPRAAPAPQAPRPAPAPRAAPAPQAPRQAPAPRPAPAPNFSAPGGGGGRWH
ncbi:MAG: hypothetical protein ACRDUS_03645 [Mycobacterium sp.]